MTLIAIHTGADRAEILTDTWSYAGNWREIEHVSKVVTFPHINAAVVCQGDGRSTMDAEYAMLHASRMCSTFDEVAAEAPTAIRTSTNPWIDARVAAEIEVTAFTVFLVGYSESEQRYKALQFASDDDALLPKEIDDDVFVMPAPYTLRPSDLELARLGEKLPGIADPTHAATYQANLDFMASLPAGQAPRTPDDWWKLAMQVRSDRVVRSTIGTGVMWGVGGEAWLTTLTDDAITQERLLTYNDEGEELELAVAGTMHPVGQAGPCPCGSGERYRLCCLVQFLDQRCTCGAPLTAAECCAIDPDQLDELAEKARDALLPRHAPTRVPARLLQTH